MFKSTKKLSDPPSAMTMQEIQEDLEKTFCKIDHQLNKAQILEDLKQREPSEISLSEWWDGFEIARKQIDQMENTKRKLDEMKNDLLSHQNDVKEQREAIQNEISDNIKRIHELKTPK